MYIRPSTAAFVILFNFAVVNAGIVPAARAVNGLEQRSELVGNYAEPATYAEPVTREESPEPDPDRREESPEPDPDRRVSTGTTLQV